jgi:hypothetical protein
MLIFNRSKPILIICNGPSTSQIDWNWMKIHRKNFNIFCMNSSYKMFDTLNFYPDFYSNLDSVVLESHKEKIKKLIIQKKIKKIFLNGLCKFDYSDKTLQKVVKSKTFFGDLSKNFYNFNSWMNTGSDSVQISIMMGFNKIFIIGVDGYLEVIKEAEKKQGNIYEVKKTPDYNPNYWFSNYQEKGELYNLPNASFAHVPGWEKALSECKKNKIELYNLSNNNYTKIPKINFSKFKETIENESFMATNSIHHN